MGLLLLAVATTVVVVGAAAVTAMLRPDSAIDAGITGGVVASAMFAFAVEAAGWAGVLQRAPTTLFATILSVTPIVIVLRQRRPIARRLALRERYAGAVTAGRESLASMLLLAVAAAAVIWEAFVGVVLTPYAYDALTYHLITAVGWIQHGNLDKSPLTPCCAHYPLTAELLFTWPMLLSGNDGVVNLVQVCFIVLGGFAVAGIARSAGVRGPLVALAGAAFVVTPVVLAQGPTEYVDVIIAAWALCALHSTIRFAVTSDVRRLVPAGLAIGMLLGSKGTGVIWAVVLVVTLVVVGASLVSRQRLSRRRALYGAATVLAACLALGSFWYVRNVAEHGNPVYPFRVSVFGAVLFDGPEHLGPIQEAVTQNQDSWPVQTLRAWAADLDFWHQHAYTYEQRDGGLGPVWAWLGAPLTLLVALGLVRRPRVLGIAVLVMGVVFVWQPYQWWSRFTIPLAGLGAVSVALAASWRVVGRLVRVGVLALGTAGAVLTIGHVDPASRAEPLDASRVLDLAGKPRSQRSATAVFFREYAFAERIRPGSRVVVDLEAEPIRFVYLLYGDDIARRVVPYTRGTDLSDAWVVTARGRTLDARVRRTGDHVLASDRRGVRAWMPRSERG